MEPIQRTAELETALSADEVKTRVTGVLQARGATVVPTPTGLAANGGSRLALRIWGVYLKWGRSRLPWQATVEVEPGERTLVRVTAASDEGFVVARVPRLTAEFGTLLGDVVSAVSASVSG